jgi:hypothetical protein
MEYWRSDKVWSTGGVILTDEKLITQKGIFPNVTFSATNGIAWDTTRSSVIRGQRRAAGFMAWRHSNYQQGT